MGVAQTRSAIYNMYYFYSPKHKKYLGVVTFKGCYNTIQRGSGEKIWYDDIEDHRLTFLYRIKSFSAYVNRQQCWIQPTAQRIIHVPIFFKRAIVRT